MTPLLPDPSTATFEDWASELSEALNFAVSVPADEAGWVEFALTVIAVPPMTAAPPPQGFESWRAWALAFT